MHTEERGKFQTSWRKACLAQKVTQVWRPVSNREELSELAGCEAARINIHLLQEASLISLLWLVVLLQENLYLQYYLVCRALKSP